MFSLSSRTLSPFPIPHLRPRFVHHLIALRSVSFLKDMKHTIQNVILKPKVFLSFGLSLSSIFFIFLSLSLFFFVILLGGLEHCIISTNLNPPS